MLARSLALGAVGLLGWGVVPAPPRTMRYRIDQTLNQEIDGTVAGAAKQQIRFSTSSFVTVTLADSGGGKTMRLVIDSIRGDSAVPIPAAVLDSARGTEFRGFVSATGRLGELQPPPDHPAAAQVQGLVSDFYPWVKPGVKVGDSWTDTTSRISAAGGDSVMVRRISTYTAAASERRGARPAVRIALDFTSLVSGTQPTPSGPARIEGTGRGTGAYYVTPDGSYLGGDWEQRSTLQISGAFAPKPLPVALTQTIKVAALR